jgi:hypothetical protein
MMERNMAEDENIVSEEFPELFHYTNVSACENIYKTRQFWATHYEDLNDNTEFERFRLKVREFIRPIIWEIFDKKMQCSAEFTMDVNRNHGIDIVVDQEAEKLLDRLHSHTFGKHMYKETFIGSFCAHTLPYEARHGLLSQWRGYGANGGVAIVLNTSCVEKMMRHEYDDVFQLQIMYMGNVIYDNNDVRIKKDFENVFELSPKILEILYPDKEQYDEIRLESLFEKMHNHFVLGSTLVKHHAFHEENEIRIVVSPKTRDSYNSYNPQDTKLPKEIRYRQIDNCEARYIELFGDAPLPIKRIIVGPSRIQNLNYQRIRGTVDKSSCIEVVKSEIPFLGHEGYWGQP